MSSHLNAQYLDNIAHAGSNIFEWYASMSTSPQSGQSDLEMQPLQPCWLSAGHPMSDLDGGVSLVHLPDECVPAPHLHFLWHQWVAGFNLPDTWELRETFIACDPVPGDANDPVTSPNDPSFFFHHANIDRSLMEWAMEHPAAGYSLNFDNISGISNM